jgi:hypothetical protein
MTPDLKNSNALELITAYNIINVYTKTFEMQDFAFVPRQEAYYNFYLAWKDLDFDKLIIEISNSKAFMGLLNRLHSNVKKYIDTSNSINYNFQDVDIFEIITISKNRYYQHRLDLLNSEKQTISTYNYSTENERAVLLEENKVELLELKLEISTYVQNIHNWFSDDYHIKIYHLSNSFLNILNDYLSASKLLEIQSKTDIDKETTYFYPELIHSIYLICDDKLFETETETHYNIFFNLLDDSTILKIKPNKMYIIIYLIKFLSERIVLNNKDHWIEEILKRLTINKKEKFNKRINVLEDFKDKGNKKAIYYFNTFEKISKIKNQFDSLKTVPH